MKFPRCSRFAASGLAQRSDEQRRLPTRDPRHPRDRKLLLGRARINHVVGQQGMWNGAPPRGIRPTPLSPGMAQARIPSDRTGNGTSSASTFRGKRAAQQLTFRSGPLAPRGRTGRRARTPRQGGAGGVRPIEGSARCSLPTVHARHVRLRRATFRPRAPGGRSSRLLTRRQQPRRRDRDLARPTGPSI